MKVVSEAMDAPELVFSSWSRTGKTPSWQEPLLEWMAMVGLGVLMVLLAELEVLTPKGRSTPEASGWRDVHVSGVVVRAMGVPEGLEAVTAWSKLDTEERQL
jgi:hypothetical protein